MSPLKPLLTANEAVEMLAAEGYEVSAETLRRWARQGHFTVVRKGRGLGRGSRILFQRNEVRELLKPTSVGAA